MKNKIWEKSADFCLAALSLLMINFIIFSNNYSSNICIIKDIKEVKNFVLALRMRKNTNFFDSPTTNIQRSKLVLKVFSNNNCRQP